MKIIFDFFRVIRFSNLLIVAITQIFACYFLDKKATIYSLLNSKLFFLILATMLCAAAGYIINDYMDVKLDLINKPHRVIIGNTITRRWAMFLHFLFNAGAVFIAYQINFKVFISVFICTLLLWFYSQFLKKTYLAGNILVAILTSFTVIILYFFNNQLNYAGIITYSIFAFFSTLIREIIKDAEDIRGDEKFKAKTIPIVKGIRATKNILVAMQLVLIALVFSFTTLFGALSQSMPKTGFLFIIYSLFLICVPMILNLWLMINADVKYDFSRLSLLSKINMLAGIVSMVFWKF